MASGLQVGDKVLVKGLDEVGTIVARSKGPNGRYTFAIALGSTSGSATPREVSRSAASLERA